MDEEVIKSPTPCLLRAHPQSVMDMGEEGSRLHDGGGQGNAQVVAMMAHPPSLWGRLPSIQPEEKLTLNGCRIKKPLATILDVSVREERRERKVSYPDRSMEAVLGKSAVLPK